MNFFNLLLHVALSIIAAAFIRVAVGPVFLGYALLATAVISLLIGNKFPIFRR